eukprot:COSAG05_NODE_22031_length_267_cov_1.220238_1_plen_75_part_01
MAMLTIAASTPPVAGGGARLPNQLRPAGPCLPAYWPQAARRAPMTPWIRMIAAAAAVSKRVALPLYLAPRRQMHT